MATTNTLQTILDETLSQRGGKPVLSLKDHRVLVVGAGGIGCELLKTLVQTGFEQIEVVDLDTIDVSNLNRQFLFRKKHVGMSKSTVAGEVVKSFTPSSSVNVKAYHGNVKDEQFDINYFKSFKVVLNALDNVNARQHVNRMCLAAGIPLVDAGTTGYLGQTMVIKKGETKCYDCEPKKEAAQQRFPICTIRSTPDKPVHCIVWAKELYKLLFGNMNESDLVDIEDSSSSSDANAKLDNATEIKSLVMRAVKRIDKAPSDAELDEYCRRVFDAIFYDEIKAKLAMRDGYKTAKFKPQPLDYISIKADTSIEPGSLASSMQGSRRLWTLSECVELFEACIKSIWKTKREAIGSLTFDKDDEVALNFVTAASNLRSRVFGIERKSPFDVKGIAGNIIHAIATTNAIVAGIQVLEAIRLIANETSTDKVTDDCRMVWVNRTPMGSGFLLMPTVLEPPVKTCVACGQAELQLAIDLDKSSLGDLVSNVLKGRLGVNSPILSLGQSVIYECGQGLDEDEVAMYEANLTKTLRNCPGGGIREGSYVLLCCVFCPFLTSAN